MEEGMSATLKKYFFKLVLIAVVFTLTFSAVSAPALPRRSYIVQGSELSAVIDLVQTYGGAVTSELSIINGVAAYLTDSAVTALQAHPSIHYVTPNVQVEASSLAISETMSMATARRNSPSGEFTEVVGADYVWEQGVTGKGVTIALVDSGMAAFNPLRMNTSKQNRLLAWKDFVQNRPTPIDPNGHGTHIASIMVNSVRDANRSYNGMAPDANLVVVRVLNKEGRGSYETVIKGIQWVVDHKDIYDIKIMNLSITGEVVAPYWADPLNQAVTRAWAEGITVITCAGNGGPDPLTVSIPGNNPYVITVGAFTDAYTPRDWTDDYLAEFSSAGPTMDAFIKPDVIAPGAHMVGMMSNASHISRQHEANWLRGTQYYEMAGTSQAAAVVAGIIALMYEENPDLTPDQVKYRLMITSMPMIESDVDPQYARANYSVFQQGAGRVNAPDAVLAADIEGSANFGMDIWKDLSGEEHYQGYAYYDEDSGIYGVQGVENTDDGYTVWDGGFGIWSGGFGIWSGGFGIWSGGFGIWSGGFGIWSGGFGIWSGGFGIWSGGFGIWSGGYGIWSGGYGIWSGNYGLWNEPMLSPTASSNEFDQSNAKSTPVYGRDQAGNLNLPDFSQMQLGVDRWVEE
jgi:serine protease AprX